MIYTAGCDDMHSSSDDMHAMRDEMHTKCVKKNLLLPNCTNGGL